MTSSLETSLVIQREKLRQQLHEQRELIARQLLPMGAANDHYPRSMTVRFLIQRKPLISKLLAEAVMVLAGVRLYRLLSALLVLVRIIKSGSVNSQKRLGNSVRNRTE